MKPVQGRMLVAVLVVGIGASSAGLFGADWQSHVKRTWNFKVQQGAVRIDLLIDTSHVRPPSLALLYEGEVHPSLGEEVGYLRDVLHQLPELDVDPRTLGFIMMRGFAEPEVARRLALAALSSKAWQSRATVSGGAEKVVEDLLRSLGAYDELNAAFEEYGLRVKPAGVEKVSSTKCLDLGIHDLPCSIRHNPQVPTGANFLLYLEKTR